MPVVDTPHWTITDDGRVKRKPGYDMDRSELPEPFRYGKAEALEGRLESLKNLLVDKNGKIPVILLEPMKMLVLGELEDFDTRYQLTDVQEAVIDRMANAVVREDMDGITDCYQRLGCGLKISHKKE